MGLFHPTYTKGSASRATRKWYLRFDDHQGRSRKLALFEDRELSEHVCGLVTRLVKLRICGVDLPPELHRFLSNTSVYIRRKLSEWKIIDASYAGALESLEDSLKQWGEFLANKGRTSAYVKQKVTRVRRLFRACGFRAWGDINAVVVNKRLAAWRASEDEAMSAQTSNFYLQHAKQFCKYMIKTQNVGTSCPLSSLDYLNTKTDRRHDRRAFTVEEFQELLRHTSKASPFWHISGSERALLYWFAVETGLRHGAIERLTVESFSERDGRGFVTIAAGARNKYRHEREVALRKTLWASMKKDLSAKQPFDLAFRMPKRYHAAKLLKHDLDFARTKWIEAAGDHEERRKRRESDFLCYQDRKGRYLDFHALRHTRGVWLFQYHNANPRQVQAQLGLITLSMVDRYTRSYTDTDLDLVERGPQISVD